MVQVMARPAALQVPFSSATAGCVLVQVIAPAPPTISVPAANVSVTRVCSESPGPALLTTISQLNGSRRLTVDTTTTPFLACLVIERLTRRRTVVGSVAVLLPGTVSGSFEETEAWFSKRSPVDSGLSSASKRRNTLLVWLMPRSERLSPVANTPSGRSQLKVSATPGAEVVPALVQSGVVLQVSPP